MLYSRLVQRGALFGSAFRGGVSGFGFEDERLL